MTDYHDFTTIDIPLTERRKLNVGDIWINAAKCKKCGDEVRSKNRHDFRSCKCGAVSVDGGSWYARRVGNMEDMEDVIIPFKEVSQSTE